jgi:hypothetical protein
MEIIDVDWKQSDKNTKAPPAEPRPMKDPRKARKGEGGYAKVSPVKNDPHMVVRKERKFTPPRENGYLQYVKTIEKHMAENPFLPRIYVANEERDPENPNLRRYTYQIEKLLHPQKLGRKFTPQQMMDVGDALINNWREVFVKSRARYKLNSQRLSNKLVWMLLVYQIEQAIEHDNYSNIKEPLLAQACQLSLGARAHTRGRHGDEHPDMDIHMNNVMARLTPVGPQIVITDPIG